MTDKLDIVLDCPNPCEYRVRLSTVGGAPDRLVLTAEPCDDSIETDEAEIVLMDSEAEHLRCILNERAMAAVK